jgi:hypothetical protein
MCSCDWARSPSTLLDIMFFFLEAIMFLVTSLANRSMFFKNRSVFVIRPVGLSWSKCYFAQQNISYFCQVSGEEIGSMGR